MSTGIGGRLLERLGEARRSLRELDRYLEHHAMPGLLLQRVDDLLAGVEQDIEAARRERRS